MTDMIQALTVFGFLLSFYALLVKWKAEARKNYRPLCDINEYISCTKAFTSKYGNIAGLPNPAYGMMFYALVFVLRVYQLHTYVLILSVCAVLGSVYLAYLSYCKQRNFCLVCTAIYVINILLFVASY